MSEARIIPLLPKRELDETLVERARRGDTDAQTEIFHRHAAAVAGILANILGVRHELADRVHDVFLVVFRDLGRLRDVSLFRAWIAAIAVNKARQALRTRRRRRWLRFVNPDDLSDMPGPEPDPAHRDAVQATYRILDELPAEERLVFALRFIEGMRLEELATACAVSLATAKRRLQRARERFLRGAAQDERLREWVREVRDEP